MGGDLQLYTMCDLKGTKSIFFKIEKNFNLHN